MVDLSTRETTGDDDSSSENDDDDCMAAGQMGNTQLNAFNSISLLRCLTHEYYTTTRYTVLSMHNAHAIHMFRRRFNHRKHSYLRCVCVWLICFWWNNKSISAISMMVQGESECKYWNITFYYLHSSFFLYFHLNCLTLIFATMPSLSLHLLLQQSRIEFIH